MNMILYEYKILFILSEIKKSAYFFFVLPVGTLLHRLSIDRLYMKVVKECYLYTKFSYKGFLLCKMHVLKSWMNIVDKLYFKFKWNLILLHQQTRYRVFKLNI